MIDLLISIESPSEYEIDEICYCLSLLGGDKARLFLLARLQEVEWEHAVRASLARLGEINILSDDLADADRKYSTPGITVRGGSIDLWKKLPPKIALSLSRKRIKEDKKGFGILLSAETLAIFGDKEDEKLLIDAISRALDYKSFFTMIYYLSWRNKGQAIEILKGNVGKGPAWSDFDLYRTLYELGEKIDLALIFDLALGHYKNEFLASSKKQGNEGMDPEQRYTMKESSVREFLMSLPISTEVVEVLCSRDCGKYLENPVFWEIVNHFRIEGHVDIAEEMLGSKDEYFDFRLITYLVSVNGFKESIRVNLIEKFEDKKFLFKISSTAALRYIFESKDGLGGQKIINRILKVLVGLVESLGSPDRTNVLACNYGLSPKYLRIEIEKLISMYSDLFWTYRSTIDKEEFAKILKMPIFGLPKDTEVHLGEIFKEIEDDLIDTNLEASGDLRGQLRFLKILNVKTPSQRRIDLMLGLAPLVCDEPHYIREARAVIGTYWPLGWGEAFINSVVKASWENEDLHWVYDIRREVAELVTVEFAEAVIKPLLDRQITLDAYKFLLYLYEAAVASR